MTAQVVYLQLLCGLKVKHRVEGNENVFEFLKPNDHSITLKTVFTYRKARTFAQGVALGRRLNSL